MRITPICIRRQPILQTYYSLKVVYLPLDVDSKLWLASPKLFCRYAFSQQTETS